MKRRARVVWRLREDALTERLRLAAWGDHECRPFAVPTSSDSQTGTDHG